MGLEKSCWTLSVAKILYFMDLRPLKRPKRLFWDVFSHVKRCWDCIRKKKEQALEISVSSLRVYKKYYDRVKTHGVGNYDLSLSQGQQSGEVKATKVKAMKKSQRQQRRKPADDKPEENPGIPKVSKPSSLFMLPRASRAIRGSACCSAPHLLIAFDKATP